MEYQSTRSKYRTSDTAAVLCGIAPDGGLFVPAETEQIEFDWKACLKKDALGIAAEILRTLLPGYPDMERLVQQAYRGKFDTEELTPLVPVGDDFVLELFHGPTSAFKDVALSMLPQLMQTAKLVEKEERTTVILTATSGDTGKAALEGFHDVPGTKIIVFYPDGGVSPIQHAQMASQQGDNVTVCAVRGNFDDCQTAVKKAFAQLRDSEICAGKNVELSSANSINIGRLIPQISYYFIAYAKLLASGRITCADPVDYTVPTGNFGDILAGYYAKMLGLPVGRLICASNSNHVLADFFANGAYDARREFIKTTSPSMDILISSNLERLLWHACHDEAEVAGYMKALAENGSYTLRKETAQTIRKDFCGSWVSEQEVETTIGATWKNHHYLCDTHTAVALATAAKNRESAPMVVLSTASPYKFPAAVLRAIGGDCSGSEFEQMERLERITGVPAPKNLAELKNCSILHKDVIDREEIISYVISKL